MPKKRAHSPFERMPPRGGSAEKTSTSTGAGGTDDGLAAWVDERANELLAEQEAARERRRVGKTQGPSSVVEEPGAQEQGETGEGAEAAQVAEVPTPLNPEEEEEESVTSPEVPDTEGTPLEWRAKLRTLIEGAKGTFDRYVSAKEELARRSSELDAQAEKIGKVEEIFRSLGERYNKYGWKTKVAVGVSLGVGATAFSTVSLPAAIACMSGIAAQRAAGMASMYLKFEKGASYGEKREEKFWQWGAKEKAMMKAMMYTVVMGVAIKEGIELASESSWGDAVHEWLRHHYPFSHTEAPVQNQVRGTIIRPEVHEPAVSASVPAPEMPSVIATPGHGYEYMTKRLWEQLQERHLDPGRYPQGSDIRRLLEANAGSIDKVAHQIAADPQHGFFHPDGTSVLIDPNAHMTIDAAGQIHISDSINAVRAPEGVPVTPAYHPAEAPLAAEPTPVAYVTITPHSPETPTTPAIEVSSHPHSIETPAAPTGPVGAEASVAGHDIITNRLNLQIPVAEAHIYADAKAAHTFVYGGSPETQADTIQKYLTLHPNSVVYGTDVTNTYRIPFHLLGRKVMAGPPIRTNGLFGFFSSWMKAPGPDDLKKLIQ